jgi:hypothetical protein
MNRKISFRGYNLKNKKWLYGYYLVNRGKHFIAEEGLQPPGMTWEDFEVDPESVGQYVAKVGGKEIYEGDIVDVFEANSNLMCMDEADVKYDKNVSSFVVSDGCITTLVKTLNRTYNILGNEYEEKLKISNP